MAALKDQVRILSGELQKYTKVMNELVKKLEAKDVLVKEIKKQGKVTLKKEKDK